MSEKEKKYFAKEYLELGLQLRLEGKIDEAIEAYNKSINFYPTANAHVQLGWSFSLKKEYTKAINECLKAIDLDPDSGNSYNDIGSYLIQLNKLDEAVTWLHKALAAQNYTSKHLPYYNLGRVFELKGEWKSAFENYNEALNIKSDFSAAKDALFKITSLLN